MNRQDACSTRKLIFCGTGILPVAENGEVLSGQDTHPTRKLIFCGTGILPVAENGEVLGGQDAHPTRKLIFCGTGILPVAENGARCWVERSETQPQKILVKSEIYDIIIGGRYWRN